MSCLIFGLAVLVSISWCSGTGIYSHLEVHKEAFVKHATGRVRRDVDTGDVIFPETATFAVHTDEGIHWLILKDAYRKGPKGVMYVNDVKGVHTYVPPRKPNYHFYVGKYEFASIVMICKKFVRPCAIFGEYKKDNDIYMIDHDFTVLHATRKIPHQIYKKGPETFDFHGDMVKGIIRNPPKTTERPSRVATEDRTQDHSGDRGKRQSSTTFVIETLWQIDYKLYSTWLALASGDNDGAMTLMYQYYHHIAVTATHIMESYPTHEYLVFPVLSVNKNNANEAYVSSNTYRRSGQRGLHGSNALNDFTDYVVDNANTYFPSVDHFMLLTEYWLGSGGSFSTLGIAWVYDGGDYNAMCDRTSTPAVAVVTDLRQGYFSTTLTHEYLHNMGLGHDGSSCDFDYVMSAYSSTSVSASRASNPYTFSSCSIQSLDASTSDFIGRYPSGTSCLESHAYYNTSAFDAMLADPPLGDVLTMDEQCHYYNGAGSEASYSNLDDVCHAGITCSGGQGTIVLSGTTCGSNMWCSYGECVEKSVETTTTPSPTTPTPSPTTPTPSPTTPTPSPTTPTPSPTTPTPSPTTPTPSPTTPTPSPTTPTPSPTTPTPSPTTPTPSPTTPTPSPTTTTPTTTTTPSPTTTQAPTTTTQSSFNFWTWVRNNFGKRRKRSLIYGTFNP